jgi:hypothetical protein
MCAKLVNTARRCQSGRLSSSALRSHMRGPLRESLARMASTVAAPSADSATSTASGCCHAGALAKL